MPGHKLSTRFRKYVAGGSLTILLVISQTALHAAKVTEVRCLDRDIVMVTFIDGEVKFKDDAKGPSAYSSVESDPADNWVVSYGALDTDAVVRPENWTISSPDDPSYKDSGKNPAAISRKAKINGMAQLEWINEQRELHYETTLEHTIYLRLSSQMKEGKHYTLSIDSKLDPEKASREFVFDSFQSRSEAIHVNLVGYTDSPTVKAADLYAWMGDGGARDYTAFEGAKVWLVDVNSSEKHEVGKVKFWKKQAQDLGGYDLTGSDVWTADFKGFEKPGTYRLAVEGVGCSQDFRIEKRIYEIPYKVSVKGFYYMRIGEAERPDIRPIPRQPLFIPGQSPSDTKVFITSMQPYHPEWNSFVRKGTDPWDKPDKWAQFVKEGMPENPQAWGGHSDALDWDRNLGHVSIIYDMLLPFILTNGAISDDDTGIAESGNGIPDILDEARYEVDFWLRLRDGEGYSHGLTNPKKDILYQAGTTVVAAWANAANAAMLADCFRIAGLTDLMKEYQKDAETAYAYAATQNDQQLDKEQNVGDSTMRGADFKMTAAAYLFNLTGDVKYEKAVNDLSLAVSDQSDLITKNANQIWATAGYLFTPSKIGFPQLQERMKKSVIYFARMAETAYSEARPSRRSSDQITGYFHTVQNVHRTLIAHKLSDDPEEKRHFLDALTMEADWGLGRNPLNMIQMTTATTPLATTRSVENAFTSGRNDGTPGLHPGHTPYLNTDKWNKRPMGNPQWMAERGYPEFAKWPRGECYYNTRWVWAHSEFTPQQTMRGKMALYEYLYGISRPMTKTKDKIEPK